MDIPTSTATDEELKDVQPSVGSSGMSVVKGMEKDVQGGVSVGVLRIGVDSRIQVLRHLGDIAITRGDHDIVGGTTVLGGERRGERDTMSPKNCVTSMLGMCEVLVLQYLKTVRLCIWLLGVCACL